jgi:AcrR family transcriptional regulator
MTAETTEQQILKAAKAVFIAKGFDGARMQEIADQAGINKALLHYYFRSKEKLFESIFSEVAASLFPAVRQLIESELGFSEKITYFIGIYLQTLQENPFLPGFIINTLNTKPDNLLKYIRSAGINPMILQHQIDEEAAKGKIRHLRAEHFLLSVISMCIFPYLARHIVSNIFNMQDSEYDAYLLHRKAEITEFVLKAIAP